MATYKDKEWYKNLASEQKDYLDNHPDPFHFLVYLNEGFSWDRSLLRGYEEHALENLEQKMNEQEKEKDKEKEKEKEKE